MQVPYVRIDKTLAGNYRAFATDAGVDLFVLETIRLEPSQTVRLPVNMAVALPEGYYGMIAGRSSTAARGLLVYVGTVDQGYRGPLYVAVANLNGEAVTIQRGDRVAQLIVLPFAQVDYQEVESLEDTARSDKGWGSTGR